MSRFEVVLQDLRYAMRVLRRSPGFALTAIVTLGLGIGINAAVFTVTNAVLFKGFPLVQRNDRIVYIGEGREGPGVSYADFEDWRDQARSFRGMAFVKGAARTLTTSGAVPETSFGTAVTPNAFGVLGVKLMLGRDFVPSDAKPGAAPVVILSYDYWKHRFGENRALVGRALQLNGVPTNVIGVMPQGFSFPYGKDFWVPLVPTSEASKRDKRDGYFAFGRLADGVSIQSARAEMLTIGRRLARTYPRTNQGVAPVLRSFDEWFIGTNATILYKSVWAAVGFVLLMACANVVNLLLGRAIKRCREVSIRGALGAGQSRIIGQLLTESVLLSIFAGALGWWIARAALHAYSALNQVNGDITHYLGFTMDYRVFAYLLTLSIGSGILFGMVPAVWLTKLDVYSSLKGAGRNSTPDRSGKRLSALLVTGQVALAVVLLAGAGVMIHSFFNVYAAHIGIESDHILAAFPVVSHDRYPTKVAQVLLFERLESRLAAIPGVESVALASSFPTDDTLQSVYELAGASSVYEQHRPTVAAIITSPEYIRTLGATLLSGRAFNDLDSASSMPVAIVNKRFAERNWPGQSAVGKRLRLYDGQKAGEWRTIVGVVSNIVQNDHTRQQFDPVVYVPFRQKPQGMILLARTHVLPRSLIGEFRREAQAVDPDLPVNLVPLSELMSTFLGSYVLRRNFTVLLLGFSVIALLLASVGLYSVIAHSVSRRTQEFGVRAALGATAHDIRKLVMRQGVLPLAIGLSVGVAVSFAVNGLLEAQLVRVSASDPVTLAAVCFVLVASASFGCLIPARRAMRVDPVIALRHE